MVFDDLRRRRTLSNTSTNVDMFSELTYDEPVSATTTDGMHPDVSELEITKVLAALGDQGRLLTVRALDRLGESDCTRLQADAGLTMSRSTFSHHQKVLREAGILHARIQGSQRILSLRRADLNTRFPGLLDAVLDPPA